MPIYLTRQLFAPNAEGVQSLAVMGVGRGRGPIWVRGSLIPLIGRGSCLSPASFCRDLEGPSLRRVSNNIQKTLPTQSVSGSASNYSAGGSPYCPLLYMKIPPVQFGLLLGEIRHWKRSRKITQSHTGSREVTRGHARSREVTLTVSVVISISGRGGHLSTGVLHDQSLRLSTGHPPQRVVPLPHTVCAVLERAQRACGRRTESTCCQ